MNFHRFPNTFINQVYLKVQNLEASLTFYQEIIGFKILEHSEKRAFLTADEATPLLVIEQPDEVEPKQPRTTGLYHFALLLPDRSDLAKILRHFIEVRYPLQGASDHLVSEALYLADPDGNGIEIYTDRPEGTWEWQGDDVIMDTGHIDAENLLSLSSNEKWVGLPAKTMMGHIHLHVADLEQAKEFYTTGLGFTVVNKIYGASALFLSTGGYHHHIGLNIWNGKGAPRPSENSVGLKWFTIVYPSEQVKNEVVKQLHSLGSSVLVQGNRTFTIDPSGNKIELTF